MIKLKELFTEGKEKTVFKSDWVSILKTEPEGTDDEYFYLHESRCDGKIVAVLLYKRTGKDSWDYGVRKEVTPAWGMKPELSALTGGVEKGDTPDETAVKEVKEESGYEIKAADLKKLGICYGTKSTDTIYFLYSCDVTGKEPGKKTGDGSKLDTEGELIWTHDFRKIKCPIFSTMVLRLGYL